MFIYYPRNLLSSTTLDGAFWSNSVEEYDSGLEQASTSHRSCALLPSMLTTRPSMYLLYSSTLYYCTPYCDRPRSTGQQQRSN